MQMKLFLWLQIMFKWFPKRVVWLSWEQQRQEVPRDSKRTAQSLLLGQEWEIGSQHYSKVASVTTLAAGTAFWIEDTLYQKTEVWGLHTYEWL